MKAPHYDAEMALLLQGVICDILLLKPKKRAKTDGIKR